MSRALLARIERLEAAKQSPAKVHGVIGGLAANTVELKDGVYYLRFPESPTGEPFADFALKQQSELLDLLRELGDAEAPQTAAPGIVGNDRLSPLPPNAKRRRYFEIHGREIDAFNIKELKSCR